MREEILPGLSMPLFPMRPKSGRFITSQMDVADVFNRMNDGWTVQLKINGDRGVVGINKGIHVANRYGSWYRLPVDVEEFNSLPPGTLMDGEILRKKFYPFEVLAYAGQSMLKSSPAEREAKAQEVCRSLGISWIYEPTQVILSRLKANMPLIEGVVLKMASSPYVPLSNAQGHSDSWIKWKW